MISYTMRFSKNTTGNKFGRNAISKVGFMVSS